jgi:uncharacterized membrane protein YidH (DUF202 family)
MKRLLNILLILFSSIIVLFGLAFAFIEARLLFSLDWSVYDFAFNGFIRYLLRLLIALLTVTIGIFEIINIKKQNEELSKKLYLSNVSLFLISIGIVIFATNYVGIICIALSSILLIIKSIQILYSRKK